ncbi:hypothetical protein [Rugosimonospora africana]|uniref:Uncharacterized protein n=1 Tax=Rugosimonospora africana TaxID=556532 RepID=A0A8J3QNM7_9ACTN|nr:hypothetical protein [Rugosimonospora africana]GIH14298.1 hypothetical protein Raf01_24700 [Rugosimonospora africana]
MNLSSSQTFLSLFQLCVTTLGAMMACLGALYYLRRVRLERPAIGRFNGRDVAILFVFLVVLPGLYLFLPQWALTTVLALTFTAALSIGFRPVLSPGPLWLGTGLLIGADLWMGHHMINDVFNWQFVWAENSLVVLLAAISVANLYVQGGMQLRHVAWFAGGLAIYDTVFTVVWPVSNLLIRAFVNHPLFPAMGMRIGFDEAIVGLGDLLVYAGFTIAAVKAYGRPGLRLALILVVVFGAVFPTLSGMLINFVDTRLDVVIPAQTYFGPAAVVGYLWLRHRYGRERTMKEYLASVDAERREAPASTAIPKTPKVESEPVSA